MKQINKSFSNNAEEEEIQYNDIFNLISENTEKYMISVTVENKNMSMELDTGAALTSMSLRNYRKLNLNNKLYSTTVKMRTYTGEIIKPVGVVYVKCNYKGQSFTGKLYIIKTDVDTIFGRSWIREVKMDLANLNEVTIDANSTLQMLLEKYKIIFAENLGEIPNFKAHHTLLNEAIPIYIKPRRIPYALKSKVEEEIDRLCKEGVITKIDHSEWGTPIVPIVKPNGNIRLCADYKVTLNKQLNDERYPIPIIEDIFVEMNGGEVFCTLDISQAYLHMVMDEESAIMQTLSTHKGTYKVNRLMFGVKTAPNIWQKFMDKLFQDIEGVKCFFDDIIIQGKTNEQLLKRIEKVFVKIQEHNLRINKEKCTFFQKRINYLGHTIDKDGLHKNPQKIEAIVNAKRPQNVNELRTFLGMANYYHKFIQNLASISNPLHRLLHERTKFNWTEACENSFKRIKKEILSERVLVHFDPNKVLVIATDASPTGLGAILSHRFDDGTDKPIAFASRSLTASERNYSQIDKEATAIFWGVNKFFHYCYGRKFILVTDHKPLTTIFHPQKTLPATSTMRLFHYAHFLSGFDYNIEYRNSLANSNADYVSRFPLEQSRENYKDQSNLFQMMQINSLCVNSNKIREETKRDSECRDILEALLKGTSVKQLGYRDNELTLQDGCIIKGTRVMIPKSLQNFILEELHAGHIGIVKMKLLARSYVYWKGIDKDVENLVATCRSCRLQLNEPRKISIHHWEETVQPWQRIHIDFAGPISGHQLFIIVDSFTKWVEIIPTKYTTSTWCITKLQEVFSIFGLPVTLVSDNGRQFVSEEFKTFLSNNHIQHKTSAPYHPATNGQAERFVQTIKKSLNSMFNEKGTLQEKLLTIKTQLRMTPTSRGVSPYESMFGRNIRTKLEAMTKSNYINIPKLRNDNKFFMVGQRVQIRCYNSKEKKWEFGVVMQRLGQIHYRVRTDKGVLCTRHVDQMLKTLIPAAEE